MERVIEILIQYSQGGLSQRISLFLQYPDLREILEEIERETCHLLHPRATGIVEKDIPCPSCFMAGARR